MLHLNVVRAKDLHDVVEFRANEHMYILVREANSKRSGQENRCGVEHLGGGVYGRGQRSTRAAVRAKLAVN